MCIVQVCHPVPCDCFRLIILNIATTNHMDQGWNHKWHDRTLWVTQRVIKPSRIFYIDHKVIFYSALYVELLVLLKKNPPQCFIGFGKEYIFRTLKYFTDKARNPYIRMCIRRADMSWVCDIIATRVLPHQVYKLFTSLFWDRLFLFLRHVVVPVQGKSPASDEFQSQMQTSENYTIKLLFNSIWSRILHYIRSWFENFLIMVISIYFSIKTTLKRLDFSEWGNSAETIELRASKGMPVQLILELTPPSCYFFRNVIHAHHSQ